MWQNSGSRRNLLTVEFAYCCTEFCILYPPPIGDRSQRGRIMAFSGFSLGLLCGVNKAYNHFIACSIFLDRNWFQRFLKILGFWQFIISSAERTVHQPIHRILLSVYRSLSLLCNCPKQSDSFSAGKILFRSPNPFSRSLFSRVWYCHVVLRNHFETLVPCSRRVFTPSQAKLWLTRPTHWSVPRNGT